MRTERIAARLTAGLALLLALAVGLYRVRTFDTFFHLAAGRWIYEHGRVPTTDPFSFTYRGAPWLDHSWGAQVLLERLHALGGFAALSLLQAALGLALLALAARSSWAYAIGLLPMFAYREVIEARPHLIGYVCLSAMLALLLRGRGRVTLLAIPIYAVWVTAHGSHLLAFALLGLGLIEREGRRYWAASLAGCIALALWLAPHALGQGGQHIASGFLEANVSEWYPITAADMIHTWPGRTFVLVVALSIAGAWLSHERRPAALLAFAMLFALALTSRRMLALFALAGQPVWLPWAAHTLERLRLPSLAALAAVLATVGLLPYGPFDAGAGLEADRFPEAAVEWMRAHPELGRTYNAYNFGGYLMWAGQEVFVDGRAITVYPGDFLERFERAYDDPREFEALRRQHHIDAVMLPTQSLRASKLRRYLAKAWQQRYADSVAQVYTPAL